MKVVAAFDFDGTLTTRDTLMAFLKFVFTQKQLAIGFLALLPLLTAFKLKLISNNRAKEKLFAYFFKGMPVETFNNHCKAFAIKIEGLLNIEALKRLQWHQQRGHTCIIVSASIENWITPWAANHNLVVVGTQISITDNKLTGTFSGENCYGEEKARRISELFPDREAYQLYAYGDSVGDKAMLKMADFAFYRKFE